MQQNYNKKRKLNKLKASLLLLMMVLFASLAQAQTTILMKDGTTTIKSTTPTPIYFYDSHGAAVQHNYWNSWYNHNENYTYVFKPANAGDKIKVTFHTYTAYGDPTDPNSPEYAAMQASPNDYNGISIGSWSLRLNEDFLSIYEGNGTVEANKITELTGNSQLGFSVMSDGAITFKFTSNSRYREEGWYATVEVVSASTGMSAQAPFIRRSTCSDAVEILPTTLGAKIYYTTNGSAPTANSTEYTGAIDFPSGTIPSGGFTVKAVSMLADGSGTLSAVSSWTFHESDRVPLPDADNTHAHTTITRTPGTNTIVMTPAYKNPILNETYVVRYTVTTNGTEPAEPTLSNSTEYTGPITCTVAGTRYKAKTFAVSCSNQVSANSVSYTVESIYAPAPVITFGDAMTITATEGESTFDIVYTTDGTDPVASPLHGTHSATTVSLTGLIDYGTTVKAIAYKATNAAGTPDPNYEASAVVTKIYVPTDEDGNTVNGTYGTVVLLDDREPHTWNYYNDTLSGHPHNLKPADLKITYAGNGTRNMTSNESYSPSTNLTNANVYTENATNVHVNIDATENEFIYLKTLENDDPDGGDNKYSYTLIPNPFQVRPVHQTTRGGGETTINSAVSVNNDHGEANEQVEGVMIRRPSSFTNQAPTRGTRSEITVNEGTEGTFYLPFRGGYADYGTKGQFIIPVSSLSSIPIGSTISALKFYSGENTSKTYFGTSVVVELGEVSQASFGSTAFVTSSLLNTVYSGTSLSRSADGTMTISFTSDYTYNGGNLLVSIGGYGYYYEATEWYGVTSSGVGVYGYNDSYSQGSIPSTVEAFVNVAPKTTITYTAGASSFAITANANPSSGGTVTGAGSYASGGSCTLTATPNSGYTFSNWTLDGTLVSTSASYTFTVIGNATYVANFTSSGSNPCTITTFPWTENFNGLTTYPSIPDCWDNSEGTTSGASYKWCYNGSSSSNGGTVGTSHDGSNCVRFESYYNNTGNTNFLKTPVLDLSSASSASLSFWYKNPYGGDFSVYISIDGGSTYTTSLVTGLTSQSTWRERTIDISDYAGQSNVVIVFKGTSNYGSSDANIYLDDVTVSTTSSSLYTVTYDSNGGTGTMTDPDSPYTDGSTVTVMNNGFTAPSGKVFASWNTAANGTGVSYAPGATFTIRANTTLYAQWVDFTVCTPTWTSTSSSYYYIAKFTATVDGESNAQINNTTTGTGRTTQDYYGTYSITAEAGSTIKYNTTPNYSGTYRYGLWVDWNQDGTFDDSGDERIYNTDAYITITEKSFTIPANTTPGDYRMRVIIDYLGTGNYLNPCGSNTNGEAEDYKLKVTAATLHHTVAAVADWGISYAYVTSGTSSDYSLSVEDGGSATFQAEVARNATFQGWYNGSTLVSSNNPYTVSNITADLTLTAKATFNGSSNGFCEGFDDYTSEANSYVGTAGSLPSGWTWYYGGNYYNTNYAPHLYDGTYAMDDIGIVMTAGTDASYGSSYYLVSDIALIEDATVTFNTWVESTSNGTMRYGYVFGDTYYNLGVATTASYSGATNANGFTIFTVPGAAAGGILTFVWSNSSSYYSAVIDNVCVTYSTVPAAPVFSLASGDYTGAQTVSITCSTASATIHYTTDGSTPTASSPTYSGPLTLNSSTTLMAIAINNIGSSAVTTATYNINPGAQTVADYRGFYAWRVKHLSSGLTIQDPVSRQTYGEGSIIYADQKIQFVTDNAEGNEVEFEALWAQAYVTTGTTAMSNYASNSGKYQNAYERNFHVVSSTLPTHHAYPYTITTIDPDGIGTVASITPSDNYGCATDVKFENMNLNMSSYYFNADGKSLVIGRGVANGTKDVAAGIYGDRYGSSTSSYANTTSFNIRIESGQYPLFYGLYSSNTSDGTSLTADFTLNITLGSDYDRAKGSDNIAKLTIAGPIEVGYYISGKSANTAINVTTLSGTFGVDDDNSEFYMGWDTGQTESNATRTLEVLGGEFLGGIAGGIEREVAAATDILKMRIRGGVVHRYLYGAGQYAEACGSRSTIITGGTFDCWISGACYGTHSSGGHTDGNTFVYFGGDAKQTNTGGIFGAGYGNYATSLNSYTVNKSFVEVADEAQVAGNVYGGGNNGYNNDDATVYLVGEGLSVAGNVYGGANMARSKKKTFVTLESGTVVGSIYGGSNQSGTVSDLATVDIKGGSVDNVFGGGLGANTTMNNGTKVTVSGGTISGNVYGGGQDGILKGDAIVEFSGGQVDNIYGAGKGTAQYDEQDHPIAGTGANVAGNTKVTVSGGTVNGSVFGGGENGTVYRAASETINWSFSVGFESSDNVSDFAFNGWVIDESSNNAYAGSYSAKSSLSSSSTDHIMYSPLVKLGGTFSFYAATYSNSYKGYYEVVVLLEDGSSHAITSGYVSTYDYSSKSVSTSAYDGQMGYIGIRHYYYGYNSKEYLWVDNVAYSTTSTVVNYDQISSVVNIKGGEVKGDVFGGGSMGTTAGPTTVNISGTASNPILRQNVFAGAYGSHGYVYVGGLKTVNVSGGRIYGSVYGGSRNANDANVLTGYNSSEKAATSITNISGGRIDQHVYAAGYYGQTFGSVYAFIGTSAIDGAPNHSSVSLTKNSLVIGGSVWAGGDWGVFTGSFGAPTISGNSNIYINGEGYSTDGNDPSATNYMNIAGAIIGSGTSCDAGKGERTLIMSNYGVDVANTDTDSSVNPFAYASRSVNTIQRFHNVIFDNTHIGFNGQGKINSLSNTEKFSLYEIDQNVYLANGSTLVMNNPSTQIKSFHNVTCEETYVASPTFTPVAYNGLGANGSDTDNKIRVNGGSYIEIRYVSDDEPEESETGTHDFESGSLPSGWTVEGDALWSVGTGDYSTSTGAHGGEYNAKITHSTTGNVTYLVTREFDYSQNSSASISLYYINRSWSGDIDGFGIYYRVNGGAWNELFATTTAHSTWTTTGSINLPNLAAHYQIGFKYTDGYGYGVGIDDISITPAVAESGNSSPSYGELSGFAHMMAGDPDNDATCAYARPKQSQEGGNILPSSASAYYNNANGNWTSLQADGGWLSYRDIDNDYTIQGQKVENGGSDQLRYENHFPNMRDNSEYYRIWRHGGIHHYVEAVVTAEADGNNTFGAVEVEVQLPSWHANTSYYRFDRTGTSTYNTLIDYGAHVLTYNGANYEDELSGNTWMFYNGTNQTTEVGQGNSTVAAALASIAETPNLNYGLVIKPGATMKSNDVNYIITGDADRFLASVDKPFNCDDNTHMPTVTLRLTYSNLISANTTLDPVLIPLVQCDEDGNILDYVTIALTINTKTQITSGFTTQVYARMDGSINTRETAVATVVLPAFNVHESGEESKFYLKKVEFRRGIGETGTDGVVLDPLNNNQPVAAGSDLKVVYAERADNTNLSVNRFAMTIGAQQNPDNSDDWRFPSGQQDGVTPRVYPAAFNSLEWGDDNDRGVFLGQGAGRQPLAFAITLYYNSNENVAAKTLMGEVVFTIEFDNYEGGDASNGYKGTFTVTAQVYRIGPGERFYVDGVNGIDVSDVNRAKFPDMPAKTINYIFNRLGYMPGDNIFIVNNLPINKETTWDGSEYQNEVNIFRYPGGHPLSDGSFGNESFANKPYLDELVTVSSTLNMKGVTMDGVYEEATKPAGTEHDNIIYPTGELGNCSFDGKANAPMIGVDNGGRLNLVNTTLMNNYNGTAYVSNNDNDNGYAMGGAVNVAYDGVLAMNSLSAITGNISERGGAVYVDGAMIVSDSVYVFDNYQTPATAKAEAAQNNVYLAKVKSGSFRVVQIGTSAADAYNELAQPETGETKIGVSKDDWDHAYDGYMPVVFAESGTESNLEAPFSTPQTLVVHDGNVYKLEKYSSTEYPDSPQYLYWLGTWVTAVTSKPEGFNAFDIDTPEELAWAISIVNGENGETAHPDTTFIITKDIDMSENTWVPIGNEEALYTGNFEGNGHHVTGLKGTLSRTDMGMFGRTDGAKIQNVIVETAFTSTADNLGAVVAYMNNGTISNVEAIGKNTNKLASGNNGGLVGVNNGGLIHSTLSASTISGGNNMGGLVAVNGGDLLNSYSVATMSDATNIGGLVAVNNGRVENCYDATGTNPAFAVENNGTIQFCYAGKDVVNYVTNRGTGSSLTGYGQYSDAYDTHAIGYMYGDNAVTIAEGNNAYVNTGDITYINHHIPVWNGLLSTLNQWVRGNSNSDITYTPWLRPTSNNINHDLPVLAFPKDNCMGTIGGTALRYSAFDASNNGIDALLERFKDETAYVFLYKSADNVEKVPSNSVKVFINEDAALKQVANADDFNATVGITFDNSCGNALDHFGHILHYDWHMMSTPLSNAEFNAQYKDSPVGYGTDANIESISGSYFPDNLITEENPAVGGAIKWDFYSYSEPDYHWINLKRSGNNHYHQDEPYDHINYNAGGEDYTNETSFIPGKGYMMAINQNSYLNATGKLNKGGEEIVMTAGETISPVYNKGWNLLGNPYQAYLNLGAIGRDCYIYDADQKVFAPVTATQSENPCIPSLYIHPHQAFFMHTDAGETFTFDYSWATANKEDGSYFRGDDRVNYPLVNLFAENGRGNRDLTVIELLRPEEGGATKVNGLRNANFQIAASFGGQRYGLLFTPEGTEKVPVHFTTEEDGTYTLTWSTYNGDFTSLFLVDNMKGTVTDMLHSDHYTFDATTEDYASRFYITFAVTGVDEYNDGDNSFVFYDGNQWIVDGKGYLDVIDVMGRTLYSERLVNEHNIVNLNGVAAGVYVMRLSDGNNTMVQKIVVR